MKFYPEKHLVGKVYDLTQENMCAMLVEIDRLKKETLRLRETLTFYAYGDSTKSFPGHQEVLRLFSDSMDISNINGIWKSGKRAREALENNFIVTE
jgi:hypothetical protein